MKAFKDLGLTVLMASLGAIGILKFAEHIHLPIVPEQRPLFFVGTVLFAVATRLLISLNEKEEEI